ncbi:MAG: hypothetical protein HY826_01810 [Actinobacteria bacterium]|nr:hypothetical protein [Actinomycetota bacterium]
MGDKKVKPPKLPANAPKELKDFVACKRLEVDLDLTKLGWLPRPEGVPESFAPSATVEAKGANAAEVKVGWGFFSIALPASVSGGELHIDTGNIPEMGGLKQSIDNFVQTLNGSLKANDKELAGLEVRDGRVHLTKRVVGAAPQQAVPATPTPKTTPTPTPKTTPAPAPAPTPPTTDGPPKTSTDTDDNKSKVGCLIGIIATLAIATGVTVFVTRDDKAAAPSDSQQVAASSSTTSRTTAPPLDERAICADLAIVEQVLLEFGVDDPCEIPPEDFWDACDELASMPCFVGGLPLIVLGPTVGISHNGSVPDAITGESGPSQSEFLFGMVGPLSDQTASIQVQSKCGDNTRTGLSTLMPTGVTSVKHPLFSFRPCDTISAQLKYAGTTIELPTWGRYEVTETPVDPGQPNTVGLTVPTATSLNATGTALGLLAGKRLDPACALFLGPDNSSARATPANCADLDWRFFGGVGDDRVVAVGAGYVNPFGTPAPTPAQLLAHGPSRLFGPGTLFPCGLGYLGYTVCAGDAQTVDTSAFVAGTVTLATPVTDLPAGSYVELQVGADEKVRLDLALSAAGEFSADLSGVEQSKAILRGNSITFMIPYDEPPEIDLMYTVSVGDASGAIAQPPQPVLGLIRSTSGPETPYDFFAQLSASIATGDLTFALDRLHPVVIEAFPGDACRAELQLRVTADYMISVDAVGEVAPWTWELPDGRTYDLPEATTVTIRLPGSSDPVDGHLASIDGAYHWFTICDGR